MTTNNTFPAREPAGRNTKSFTRFFPAIARVLLGLVFVVTGLNGFLNFLPQPANMAEGALAFVGAMMKTGYLYHLVMATQLIVGLLLLLNLFVPLALALLAPIVVNILAFHLFLERPGIVLAVVVLLLEIYLVWAYRNYFRPMLATRATPK